MTPVLGASAYWYLTRGAGTVSLVLLTVSVLLGLVTWSRWRTTGWPRFITAGLHRNISLLALCLVAFHAITAATDSYAPIRLVDAVLPFASAYRPLWLGFGAVAFDLLLALAVTSLLRRHIGPRVWRAVHWLSYACWGIAVVHAFGTGTDPRSLWFAVLGAVCVLAVLAAALARVERARSGSPVLRRGLTAGALTAATAVIAWVALGPLHAGWAARAGTPQRLLSGASGRSSVATALPAVPFEVSFRGQIVEDFGEPDSARLEVDTTLGQPTARLRVLFIGRAGDGVLVPSRIEVRYGAEGDPGRFTGEGRLKASNEIVAAVSDGKTTLDLTIRLQLDLGSGTAAGVVSATGGTI